MPEETTYLSRRRQAARYNRTTRTIARWENDPKLNYPSGININGLWYRRLDHLEAWEAERAKAGTAEQPKVPPDKSAKITKPTSPGNERPPEGRARD
jgi:hypothetical protein